MIASIPTPCHGQEASPLLERLLRQDPRLASVAASASTHRLQVLLGLIDEEDGRGVLRQQGFRVDAEYFYPASAIKLFAAVAALETLADLRRETGLPIDERTALVFHPLFADEKLEKDDSSNRDGGKITVGHELRKLFLVSDNQAFNRLYELVGQDGLHHSLSGAGLGAARIVHRLSEPRSEKENRRMPRIELVGDGFRHVIPRRESAPLPALGTISGLAIGRGFMHDGELVASAMDFSAKNRMSLVDLQRGLAMVVRPDIEVGSGGFQLTAADRQLLLAAMVETPRESSNPRYDPGVYPDAWVKLLLPGLAQVVPAKHLRVYNKMGRAYGFSVENAYVVDERTGRGFFLAAALYTNADGILNDDVYEYETIADPFFAALGEAVACALWGSQGRALPEPRSTR